MEFEITATLSLVLTRTIDAPSLAAAQQIATDLIGPVDLTEATWEQSGGTVGGWDIDDSAEIMPEVVLDSEAALSGAIGWPVTEVSNG